MADTTTKLRLLLANVIADAGVMREVVSDKVREQPDAQYLLQEVDRLQATAHRIVVFLDHDTIELSRQ